MKNRIISILIICIMLFQTGLCAMASDVQAELSNHENMVIKFIDSFGFADVLLDDKKIEDTITRAEFAAFLSECCGLNPKTDGNKYLDEILSMPDEREVLITEAEGEALYDDVPVKHWAYDYIRHMKNHGLMNGYSKYYFRPDKTITVNEALKVLINVLNYDILAEMQGGYPKGYYDKAEEIGVLDNIGVSGDDTVDWLTLQKLIYNALHTTVLKENYTGASIEFSSEKSQMLITKLFDIDYIEGVVKDNGITSLTGPGTTGNSAIKVGDMKLRITEETNYLRSYLGHSSRIYYYNEDSDKSYEAVYGRYLLKETVLEISMEDIEEIQDTAIVYNVDGKSKKAKLKDFTYVIVNGEAVSVYNDSIFEGNDGRIELISWDNSEYDIIFVWQTENCFVDQINIQEEIVYNRLKGKEEKINTIDLKKYEVVTIYTPEGNLGSLENIAVKDVLEVERGKKNITIHICRDKVEGYNIKEKASTQSGKETISNGESEYKVSGQYTETPEKTTILMNKTYTLYLNNSDEVVWVELSQEDGKNEAVGVLTRCSMVSRGGEDEVFVKLYAGGEEFEQLFLAERIKLDSKTFKALNCLDSINKYVGALIKYRLNEEQKIVEIITPADYGDRTDRGLYRMNIPGEKLFYSVQVWGFDNVMFRSGGTAIYSIPENQSEYGDIEAFSSGNISFYDNESVIVDGYTTTLDQATADYLVVKRQASGGTVSSDAVVIEDIIQTIDEDDEPCYQIIGYGCGRIGDTTLKRRELFANEDTVMIDENDSVIPGFNLKDLEAGDIIRYGLDSKGNIETVNMAYDYSEDKAYNYGSTWQVQHGYAYSADSEYLRVCVGMNPVNLNFENIAESQKKLKNYSITGTKIVKIEGDKIRMGNTSDIVTYVRGGSNCSKIVVLTEYAFGEYIIAIYE